MTNCGEKRGSVANVTIDPFLKEIKGPTGFPHFAGPPF